MKKLLALVTLTLIISGLSTLAEAAFPVEGSWGMQQSVNGITFDMTFKIEPNTITVTNVCTFQGRQATARVSSPATIDATTLTVLASAHDDENQNGVNCNVSVQPDRMNYEVQGNSLILSHDGSSDRFTLTRK